MIKSSFARFGCHLSCWSQKWVVLSIIVVQLLLSSMLYAQNAADSTGVSTEVVDVVKSYTPTIIIRPKSKWQIMGQKDDLIPQTEFNYVHEVMGFSPSDLPSILAPSSPWKEKEPKNLPNYLRILLGTRASAGLESFVIHEFNKDSYLTAALDHQQLKGPIEGVTLSTDWAESNLRTQWHSTIENRASTLGLSLKRSAVQWYGIPDTLSIDPSITADFGQTYHRSTLYHRLGTNGGWFTGMDNEFYLFSDQYGITEWQFSSAPKAEFLWDKRLFSLAAHLSFLSMNLGLEDTSITSKDYTAFNADLGVQTDLDFGDLKVNLGARVWGHNGSSENTLRLFPELELNYRIFERRLYVYAGFSGQYQQYQANGLTQTQAFIAPGFELKPQIDKQILRFGVHGAPNDLWQYQLGVSYRNFENQAYFIRRPWSGEQGLFAYDNGNSFNLLYAQGTELKYTAKINGRLSDQWDFALDVALIDNRPANDVEPWNIPALSFGGSGTYHFNDQLLLTGRFMSYGSRKDQFILADEVSDQVVDGFIDAQLHVHYSITKNFSTSLSGINLLNQNSGLWINYPVQGTRVNLGLQYNFKSF